MTNVPHKALILNRTISLALGEILEYKCGVDPDDESVVFPLHGEEAINDV
jgi:hypothetical protein